MDCNAKLKGRFRRDKESRRVLKEALIEGWGDKKGTQIRETAFVVHSLLR